MSEAVVTVRCRVLRSTFVCLRASYSSSFLMFAVGLDFRARLCFAPILGPMSLIRAVLGSLNTVPYLLERVLKYEL